MIRRRRPVESVQGSTPRSGPLGAGLATASAPARLPRRALAVLGLLLVVGAIELGWQYLPAAAPEPAVVSMAGMTLPPPEDLAAVPANWSALVPVSPFRFTEVAREAGIDFVHVSGMTEAKHFPTAYGSGVAMFDCDNDGRLDLYFATTTFLPVGSVRTGPNRLYRNLGDGRFQEATRASGLGYAGFCHGIVVGDIDNDGDPDVFLCNYGSNVLYRNNGDGTFTDISQSAGIDQPGWSSGGAFLDYDHDGDLDLYVARYGTWKLPDDDRYCPGAPGYFAKDPPKLRVYCSPKSIQPARHI
ncbi:MAG TPA: VCBS repeat-containing protein, partial [Isosphaeraceae bacterium]|nr:VCBS repeat-containing protein [Isosphaeraceae bacterium]